MRIQLRIETLCQFIILFRVISFTVPNATGFDMDNDIVGEPDIECLDEQIRVYVKTRKNFTGRIYAKGKADNPECSKDDFGKLRTKKPHVDLKFGQCGMKSLRSTDPRGLYYGITLVVSFHTMFITKVDQAFHVKCFFEESSKGLTAELGVSMLATTEYEARHSIPGCTYSIHSSSIEDLDAGRPAGRPIQFARIGDRVLHQWHCEDQMYGILINNCYVTDGFGKRADVVDSKGCAVDPMLITGIRYAPDLQRAYAESQVFKFADRPGVWFFCQIQTCMKNAGMCDSVTPPLCAQAAGGFSEIDKEGKEEGGKRISTYSTKPLGAQKKEGAKGESEDYGVQPIDLNGDEYGGETLAEHTQLHTHSSTALPYIGISPPGPDYESLSDRVTALGPGFPMPGNIDIGDEAHFVGNLPRATTERSQTIVTAIFETEEETEQQYKRIRPKTPGNKYEYAEYDEDITIPPNLNDLLSKLPDDINAASLQKMFRDSVEDRRTLLRGFEFLNQMREVEDRKQNVPKYRNRQHSVSARQRYDWSYHRMSDTPLAASKQGSSDENTKRKQRNPSHYDEKRDEHPVIAGRILVYDIDEEPPQLQLNRLQKAERGDDFGRMRATDCAISREGLLVIASGLGGLSAVLFTFICIMYFKLFKSRKRTTEGLQERSLPPSPLRTLQNNYKERSVDDQPNTPYSSKIYASVVD